MMHWNFPLSILPRQIAGLWLALVSCFSLSLSAGEPGKMTREVWLETPTTWLQNHVSSVANFKAGSRYFQVPDSVSSFTGSSAPNDIADYFFSRYRAILTAPVTGNYTFWMAADDDGELFLSPTASKLERVKIASCSSWEGWTFDFFPSQKSVLIPLVAGQRYLIEAHHYEGVYGDNMSIAWQLPGGVRTLIPATALESFTVDPADLDNDEMLDSWEVIHGFSTTDRLNPIPAHAPGADPDKDGINNVAEASLNLSPFVGNIRSGNLTFESWANIFKSTVGELNQADAFFGPPSRRGLLASSSNYEPLYDVENSGSRIRGTLVAPVTGPYRFWVSARNGGELWLGTNASKSSKRRLAAMGLDLGTGSGIHATQPGMWDQYPCQMSAVINLTAGQEYFFEMLTQQGVTFTEGYHVSAAWALPGQPREAIPASAFRSYAQVASDADDDYLPDAWESQYGLNPNNNGLTDRARQGQNGDFDADGLTNLTEYQVGTNPASLDTDGDGISDGYEVNGLFTNPLVTNPPVSTLHSTIALGSFVSSSTPWTMTSGGLVPTDFRGDVTWNFSVPSAGNWLLQLEAEIMGVTYGNEMVPVVIKVDGKTILRRKMNFGDSKFAILEALTQTLTAGPHQVTVMVDNMLARRTLRLVSLKVFATTVANANSILAQTDRILPLPTSSRTSPAFIEGYSRDIAATTVNLAAVSLGTGNGHWYANLPLSATTTPTNCSVQLGSGALVTSEISWRTTNTLRADSLTIRQGDSLKVGAWNNTYNQTSSLTLSSGGTWNLPATALNAPKAFIVISFPNAGTFTVNGTLQDGASGLLTVKVIAPPTFTTSTIDILAGSHRQLDYACDPLVAFETPDELCRTTTGRMDATTTAVYLYAPAPEDLGLAARLFAGGPILAVQNLNVIGVSDALQNDLTTTGSSPIPGYKLLTAPMTVVNLPQGAWIDVWIIRAGVMFPNGTYSRVVRSSDIVNGSVTLEFLFPLGEPGGYCHQLHINGRNGEYLGNR